MNLIPVHVSLTLIGTPCCLNLCHTSNLYDLRIAPLFPHMSHVNFLQFSSPSGFGLGPRCIHGVPSFLNFPPPFAIPDFLQSCPSFLSRLYCPSTFTYLRLYIFFPVFGSILHVSSLRFIWRVPNVLIVFFFSLVLLVPTSSLQLSCFTFFVGGVCWISDFLSTIYSI